LENGGQGTPPAQISPAIRPAVKCLHIALDQLPLRTVSPQRLAAGTVNFHKSERLETCSLQAESLSARARADFNAG
jgi:hypothetical protein